MRAVTREGLIHLRSEELHQGWTFRVAEFMPGIKASYPESGMGQTADIWMI